MYNTSINQIINITLFFINHKYNITLFFESKEVIVLIEQVNVIVKKM